MVEPPRTPKTSTPDRSELALRLPVALRNSSELIDLLYAMGMRPRDSGYLDLLDKVRPLIVKPVDLPATLKREWFKARKLLDTLAEHRDQLTPMFGHGLDALEGQVTDRPLLSCLLQSPGKDQEEQIWLLQQILIAGILLHREGRIGERILTGAAAQIRLAARTMGDQRDIVKLLPAGTFGTDSIIEMLKNATRLKGTHEEKKEGKEQSASVRAQLRFLTGIQKLTRAVLSAAHPHDRQHRPKPVELEDTDDKVGSILAEQSVSATEHTDDIEETLRFRVAAAEPGGELSEAGVRAAATLSRYWLAQAQTGFVWDRRRINPMEFPRLQAFLGALPDLTDSGRFTPAEALVTALVASLGRDAEEILALQIGQNAELSLTGMLRRQVPSPDEAYEPPPEAHDSFRAGHAVEMSFELPDAVKQLLGRALGTPEPQGPITIGTLCHLDGSNVTPLRETIGNALRERVSPRLEHRHLNTVLRHETFSATRDPLLTYLITGRPRQLPPVGLYYTAVNVESVKRIHRTITHRLFGGPDSGAMP